MHRNKRRPHWITSSDTSEQRSLGGISKPSALGSFEIDNKFKLVGCSIGDQQVSRALSPLQFQLAHEIASSKRRALVAENVVSCGRIEKEVRQRE